MAGYSNAVNTFTVLNSGVFHDYKDSELQPFSDIGHIGSPQNGNRGWQIPFPVTVVLQNFLGKIIFVYYIKDALIIIQSLRTRLLRDY